MTKKEMIYFTYIQKLYAPNNRASEYDTQKVTAVGREIEKSTCNRRKRPLPPKLLEPDGKEIRVNGSEDAV